ncbi:MAG: PhoH family protein, partial [Planctomycetes bacterium]|nr:PhoH family protein [Planctomycetota bacterium]
MADIRTALPHHSNTPTFHYSTAAIQEGPSMAKKSFVLDTNVLLHNANALTSFADNEVVIPITVLEELDKFKSQNNDLGRNARQVIRSLDRLRARGKLKDGVRIEETGGTVRVALKTEICQSADLDVARPDNQILSVACGLHTRGQRVIFVSKDINARIKADALGLSVMDFEKQKVDFEKLYAGWREMTVPTADVERFYAEGRLPAPKDGLYPNEFVLLKDVANPSHTAIAKHLAKEGVLCRFLHENVNPYGIRGRNLQQKMALELLLSEQVELVTLVGQAGTGKTLLAVAAGLHKVLKEKRYERLLVSRPIMPLGQDIGFLPGTKEEKLSHWMQPIFDNLKYLLHHKAERGPGDTEKRIEELLNSRVVELEALTYIRGRSIPNQFIIVDEAQNLTPHEIKTIVSRAGEDSKVVLTGDPYQIDNPYL